MSKILLEDEQNIKQWEDARCPVCMEHPHNAILLICSSHDSGCRPFMCDTSYRHSNCFDQFRKSSKEASPSLLQRSEDAPSLSSPRESSTTIVSETSEPDLASEESHEISTSTITTPPCDNKDLSKLICPLCRGSICGWTVVESARNLMNAKSRSCSCETCDFTGTYRDLRKHARSMHPFVRPTATDPERQRNWRRLERQRDVGDLLSTLQSSFGDENSDETTLTIDDGGWLTVFFLVRFIRIESSSRSGSTRSRAQEAVRRRASRRRLWGEAFSGENEARDDDNESSDNRHSQNNRRVRRRLNDHGDEV